MLLKLTSLVLSSVSAWNWAPSIQTPDLVFVCICQNTFSERLSPHGLDVYTLVAVDVLHEVEIGVWKSLFIQLLRLLESIEKSRLNILNGRLVTYFSPIALRGSYCSGFRFRQIPTFGRDTIRRFRSNVSEMRQFAARDYEDILQVRFSSPTHSYRVARNRLLWYRNGPFVDFLVVCNDGF